MYIHKKEKLKKGIVPKQDLNPRQEAYRNYCPSLCPLSHGTHIRDESNLKFINKICLPCLASKLQKSKENIGKINKITCLKFIRGRRQGKSFN